MPESYVLVVSGSRDWIDETYVRAVLAAYPARDTILIHGAARGLDSMAARIAREMGFVVLDFPADWTPKLPGQRYDPQAGPRRNQEMVDYACHLRSQGDIVFCECFPLPQSRGTYDFIDRAHTAELRTHRLGWTTYVVPSMNGMQQYTHLIRSPDDPGETAPRGKEHGDPLMWRQLVKLSAVDWEVRILDHLRDGVARTFNRIAVELTGKTADILAGKSPDEGLWNVVRKGLVEYTFADSPVYFRLRAR